MLPEITNLLSDILGEQILGQTPVHGGDISRAYKLQTTRRLLFLKISDDAEGLSMFRAEAEGLRALTERSDILTPDVIYCDRIHQYAILVMDFIEPVNSSVSDMQNFGRSLAALHLNHGETFGWLQDNYIGSLIQRNTHHEDWKDFYISCRLLPQLKLAQDNGRLRSAEIPSPERLDRVLTGLVPNCSASLLHGDLWSGNYLISAEHKVYLIDPAVYYGHSEIDLAMSRLFGGFDGSFYAAYHEVIPQEPGIQARCDLYQLYYLLVHVNLFGASYYPQVKRILQTYVL